LRAGRFAFIAFFLRAEVTRLPFFAFVFCFLDFAMVILPIGYSLSVIVQLRPTAPE
jgi:hypothetical protein